MGCTPSKPSKRDPGAAANTFPPYKGPKEFRSSALPKRKPHPPTAQTRQMSQQSTDTYPTAVHGSAVPGRNPTRQAGRMYQKYQAEEQERAEREKKRYSWEGHPTEKIFMTFELLAARGVIPKDALKSE